MTDHKPLTIGERIAVHLSQYARHQDDYVVPPEMSQTGIAGSLGISRAHAAIELKRAIEAKRVEVRIGHVTGSPTRRKVYRLTPRGLDLARSVRDRVVSRMVEVVHPDGRAEPLPGPRVLEVLRRHGVGEGRAVLLVLSRSLIDIRSPTVRGASGPRMTPYAEDRGRIAFERAFVHPYAWQLRVVLGPPHRPRPGVAA